MKIKVKELIQLLQEYNEEEKMMWNLLVIVCSFDSEVLLSNQDDLKGE